MDSPDLAPLLAHPSLWRFGSKATQTPPGIATGVATGFATLDAELVGGGWPLGGISEIVSPHQGLGELALIQPALATLTASRRTIVLVNPPYIPYAPAWLAQGIDLDHLLWVQLPKVSKSSTAANDALWAAEQALLSPACAGVLLFQSFNAKAARRLQLAAEQGTACVWLLRSGREQHRQAFVPALRLAVDSVPVNDSMLASGELIPEALVAATAKERCLWVQIQKCRGPGRGKTLRIPLPLDTRPSNLSAGEGSRESTS